MYNKILAIDFETANWSRTSTCSIGYALLENGKITSEETLINPEEEFDYFNIEIHGITPEDVENSKIFPQVWNEIEELIDENTLVIAHNAAFDMSVIRYTCDKYEMNYPTFDYVCTWRMGKKHYQKFTMYSLDYIANELGLEFKHHNAKEDASVCLEIFRDIIKTYDDNIEKALEHFELKKGKLFEGGYIACGNKYKSKSKYKGDYYKIDEIVASTDEFDEDHPFYDKTIIFTGTLSSMPRKEAMLKVVNSGGHIGNRLLKKTNYLVMGVQDIKKLNGKDKSNKVLKAEEYIELGSEIEIIGEDTFLQLI